MKHCQTCGKELEETERVCLHCGSEQPEPAAHYAEAEYEIEEPEEPQKPDSTPAPEEPKRTEDPSAPQKKRISGLSVAALICALTFVLAPLGVLFAIIDLAKSKGRQTERGMSAAVLIIGGLIVIFGIVGIVVPRLNAGNRHRIVSIECGYDVVAGLRKDGTVAVSVNSQWIDPAKCEETSGWTDIVQIATTETSSYLFGVKKDGTVVICTLAGNAFTGQKGDPKRLLQSWTDIVAIDCAGSFIYGLKKDGTVETADLSGYSAEQEPEAFDSIRTWKDIRKIKAVGWDLYGWKADGTVVSTYAGEEDVLNSYGSSIVDLDGLGQAEAALLKNGDMVYLWKDQPESSGLRFDFPQWHGLREIIVYNSSAMGLKEDGTVVSVFSTGSKQYNPILDTTVTVYGGNDFGQRDVAGWSEIVDICGTDVSAFGLRKDGTVVHTGNTDWFDPEAWN